MVITGCYYITTFDVTREMDAFTKNFNFTDPKEAGSSEQREGTMKTLRKEMKEEKKETNRYLSCPRCGGVVLYHRRNGHRCFRRHLMEIEMNLTRMGRAQRV